MSTDDGSATAELYALQPYLIAFSAGDGAVADAGGVATITGRVVAGIAAAIAQLGYDVGADFFEADGNGMVSVAFDGANVLITVNPVERFADRAQWQAKFMSRPDYLKLTEPQRDALAIIHAAATYHIVDADVIEAVDVARPVGGPIPPRPSPAASVLKH